jgi:hypothetical protein
MGTGKVRVTQCLFDEVTPDVWELLEAMNDADHGNLPVHGGTLDQARVFMDALRYARELNDRCKVNYERR